MKNELLIKKVFDRMAIMIISNVDDNYRNELLDAYKDYLIECYYDYNYAEKDNEKYVNTIIELETSKWKNEKQNAKLVLLLKDDVLEEIREISNNGYNYAINKLNSISMNNNEILFEELDKTTADKNIALLQELLPKVREFNSGLAASLVSEGILDFEYASGNSNHTSLRIGRLSDNIV